MRAPILLSDDLSLVSVGKPAFSFFEEQEGTSSLRLEGLPLRWFSVKLNRGETNLILDEETPLWQCLSRLGDVTALEVRPNVGSAIIGISLHFDALVKFANANEAAVAAKSLLGRQLVSSSAPAPCLFTTAWEAAYFTNAAVQRRHKLREAKEADKRAEVDAAVRQKRAEADAAARQKRAEADAAARQCARWDEDAGSLRLARDEIEASAEAATSPCHLLITLAGGDSPLALHVVSEGSPSKVSGGIAAVRAALDAVVEHAAITNQLLQLADDLVSNALHQQQQQTKPTSAADVDRVDRAVRAALGSLKPMDALCEAAHKACDDCFVLLVRSCFQERLRVVARAVHEAVDSAGQLDDDSDAGADIRTWSLRATRVLSEQSSRTVAIDEYDTDVCASPRSRCSPLAREVQAALLLVEATADDIQNGRQRARRAGPSSSSVNVSSSKQQPVLAAALASIGKSSGVKRGRGAAADDRAPIVSGAAARARAEAVAAASAPSGKFSIAPSAPIETAAYRARGSGTRSQVPSAQAIAQLEDDIQEWGEECGTVEALASALRARIVVERQLDAYFNSLMLWREQLFSTPTAKDSVFGGGDTDARACTSIESSQLAVHRLRCGELTSENVTALPPLVRTLLGVLACAAASLFYVAAIPSVAAHIALRSDNALVVRAAQFTQCMSVMQRAMSGSDAVPSSTGSLSSSSLEDALATTVSAEDRVRLSPRSAFADARAWFDALSDLLTEVERYRTDVLVPTALSDCDVFTSATAHSSDSFRERLMSVRGVVLWPLMGRATTAPAAAAVVASPTAADASSSSPPPPPSAAPLDPESTIVTSPLVLQRAALAARGCVDDVLALLQLRQRCASARSTAQELRRFTLAVSTPADPSFADASDEQRERMLGLLLDATASEGTGEAASRWKSLRSAMGVLLQRRLAAVDRAVESLEHDLGHAAIAHTHSELAGVEQALTLLDGIFTRVAPAVDVLAKRWRLAESLVEGSVDAVSALRDSGGAATSASDELAMRAMLDQVEYLQSRRCAAARDLLAVMRGITATVAATKGVGMDDSLLSIAAATVQSVLDVCFVVKESAETFRQVRADRRAAALREALLRAQQYSQREGGSGGDGGLGGGGDEWRQQQRQQQSGGRNAARTRSRSRSRSPYRQGR